ncbi:hypothetical protein A1D31_10375 [Bradyrhizobium liaoningense]|nr:hypothetical protein A1D31_10375 [Bradyrhizobium liaoningense]
MRGAGQPIQKAKQDCGQRPIRLDLGTGGCGEMAQREGSAASDAMAGAACSVTFPVCGRGRRVRAMRSIVPRAG